jgi:hypothetical protein
MLNRHFVRNEIQVFIESVKIILFIAVVLSVLSVHSCDILILLINCKCLYAINVTH